MVFFVLRSAKEWKVPTTFIYGYEDWMDYRGAQLARQDMKVPCEIIRVPQVPLFSLSYSNQSFISLREPNQSSHSNSSIKMQGGHFVFIDNPSAFHSAVFHACRRFLKDLAGDQPLPEGLTSA